MAMDNLLPGHDLPPPDMAGHVQPQPDTQFTMTVEDAVLRYAQLGHPRNPRSVRRFCQQGTIDCRKIRTSSFSEMYLIDPVSIERHAKEISETFPTVTQDIAGHDLPGPDMSGHVPAGPDGLVTPAPGGWGIAAMPDGRVFFASLAGNYPVGLISRPAPPRSWSRQFRGKAHGASGATAAADHRLPVGTAEISSATTAER